MDPASKKNILIAPLDWGLGHATRCIPLIRECLSAGHQVIIGTSGRSLRLLQDEFPALTFVEIPSYNIYYQESGSFIWKIIKQLNKVFSGIRNEKKITSKVISGMKIDLIISDNRYGVYCKNIYSVLISHQMMVRVPGFKWIEYLVFRWLQGRHKKFREVWIPDVPSEINISGDLSHKYKLNGATKFIGVLTRFDPPVALPEKLYDVIAILSGPEPQRTIFEEIIISQAKQTELKYLIVSGKSENKTDEFVTPFIRRISYLKADEVYQAILRSEIIISRGGYSTLMDLALLGKRCIFVPTPGQTEQEYIVEELAAKSMVYTASQDQFDLKTALQKVREVSPFMIPVDHNDYKNHLHNLFEKVI